MPKKGGYYNGDGQKSDKKRSKKKEKKKDKKRKTTNIPDMPGY